MTNRSTPFPPPKASVINWLLNGDPAIRWQAMQDLTHETADSVAAERARISAEGWGAMLLAQQAVNGRWGGEADEEPPYMCTTNALVLLKKLGLDPTGPEARQALDRVCNGITWWQLDGRPYFAGETEPCVNGRILEAGAYFGEVHDRLVDGLLSEQLTDGGWNCDPESHRSSFHTTICVLEGLLEYEKTSGADTAVADARHRAHEYLLERRMFRSARTGNVIDRKWTRFSFPTAWSYDVLRGLDYLCSAGVKPDERVADAVALVAQRQHQNGRWPAGAPRPDHALGFVESPRGTASRWNTLRALRVLSWYAAGKARRVPGTETGNLTIHQSLP